MDEFNEDEERTGVLAAGRGYLLLLGWLFFNTAVVVLSLLPSNLGSGDSFENFIEHFLAYLLSALGATLVFRNAGYILTVGLALIVGGGWLEVAQAGIPGRFCALDDFLANCAGVAAGLTLGWAFRAFTKRGGL